MEEIREKSVVAVVNNGLINQICSSCFKQPSKLLRCSSCKFTSYCDRNCQGSDWKQHKSECIGLQKICPHIPPDFVRFMARVIFYIKDSDSSKSENNYRSFHDLMAHISEIRKDPVRQENLLMACVALKKYLKEDELLDSEILITIFGKLVTNTFTILDSDLNAVGTGLYLRLSILDHSCTPNATVVFEGNTAILRPLVHGLSLEDLSQIHISYIELLSTKDERQNQLKSQYYFECQCSRCKDSEDEMDLSLVKCRCNDECCCDIIEHTQLLQWKMEKLDNIKKSGNSSEIVKMVEDCLENEVNCLADLHVFRIRLLESIMDACIDLNMWNHAIKYAKLILPAYRFYYSKNHPSIGLHLMKIGKIMLLKENLREAMLFYEEADRIIGLCYGRSHEIYHEVMQTLGNIRTELKIQNVI